MAKPNAAPSRNDPPDNLHPRTGAPIPVAGVTSGRFKKMTLRFATYEGAALAAAKLRDDGHFAEIFHDTVALLWGRVRSAGSG